ncbi:hypothetical protein PG984_003357 [Apiospora sp. TS-2023a]
MATPSSHMHCAPKGWPAIASRQMFYPNAAVHRKFTNLTQRILGHFEVQIDCIDQELLKLDRKDAQLGLLGSLPFDRDEFLDRCRGIKHRQQHDSPIQQKQRTVVNQQARPLVTPELRAQQTNSDNLSQPTAPNQQHHTSRNEGCRQEKAHLLDNAMALLKEYHHFINLNRDFQSMPRVSRKQHLMHYLAIKNEHLPGKATNQYLWARDDFVNTDRDTVHQWFGNILYSKSPVFQVRTSMAPERESEAETTIRARRLGFVQKMVLACTSAVLLLIPVGLLHFHAESGKLVSFAIACASTLVFIVVITCLETDYGRALVGLCAFVAVLASFLANLSGNGAC